MNISLLNEIEFDKTERLINMDRIIKEAEKKNHDYAVLVEDLAVGAGEIESDMEHFEILCNNSKSDISPVLGVTMLVKTLNDCEMEYVPIIAYPVNKEGMKEIINISRSEKHKYYIFSDEKKDDSSDDIKIDEDDISYCFTYYEWASVCENCDNLVVGFMLFENELFMSTMHSVLDWAFVPHFVFVNNITFSKRTWNECKRHLDKDNVLIVPSDFDYLENSCIRMKESIDDYDKELLSNNQKILNLITGGKL